MKSYLLKTGIRNLANKKFLSLAKVLGLVVGFTVFIFLTVKIQYENSYDAFWDDSESIYRVALNIKYQNGEQVQSARNFGGSSELLDLERPEVISHCNFGKDVVTIFNGPKHKIQDVDFVYSDPTFFDVFNRKIIKSESTAVLENIHGVAISESFAKKLFGDEDPINKEITVNEGWKFVVDAVFEDIPSNSHMKIDVIATFKSLFYYLHNFDNTRQVLVDNPNYTFREQNPYLTNRWQTPAEYRSYCYIKLKKGTNIKTIEADVDRLLAKVPLPQNLKDGDMNFIFQPIKDIHLKSNLDHEQGINGDTKQVFFLSIIILVVLFVCLINFINLNTITSMESIKNYAIRIFNGSTYTQIFQLMLAESFLLNILAIVISIPLAYILVSKQLPINIINPSIFLYSAVIVLAIILIAAFMPFFSVVKNGFSSGLKIGGQKISQKWKSQKLLVTMQFSITIILIVCTIGIYKQMQFMTHSELGFNGTQTLFSFTPMTMNGRPDLPNKLSAFRNELESLKGIKSFSTSSSIPGKMAHRINNQVKAANAAEPFPASFSEISIDDAYLKAYDINLIAGERLSFQNNWRSNEMLINQTALQAMGISNPKEALNKLIFIGNNTYKIKGVIEDYHHASLRNAIKPTIYVQNLNWDHGVGFYSFQLSSNDISATVSEITQIWNTLYPKEEFIYNFSDASFASQYERDQKFNQILTYSACLALFISCLGLLGVALFNTKKRIKEIGIRKVSGAKVSQIIMMLNMDFLKWVFIAYIIAVPVSWYAINMWLQDFAYRTTISWWIFGLAGTISIAIALATVSWHSFKAATNNPVKALKDE
ncbi:ABC transporter permease [Flavivirga eckloniae]|uniref:Uncharacterized protein n=1 Tax=Flavivirga eckloniae TaxID=1803846 RepID=A0A2K9PN44_9FLAO|nr:ABC transporter permease [Flavivirga eckloniae]AUP78484.1 hypothetical protein C1H87_07080 [Flavivirga eckloniae]